MRFNQFNQPIYEVGDKVVINFDTYPQEHVHEIEHLRGKIGTVTLTRDPDTNGRYQITSVNPKGLWQPAFYETEFDGTRQLFAYKEIIPAENN